MRGADTGTGGRHAPGLRRAGLLLVCIGLVPPVALWAMSVGSTPLSLPQMAEALFSFDGSRAHIVIMDVRLPRILAGLMVGAQLAVAGAIMQAVTGNPLASPGLLGVNAGAAFAVVMALSFFGLDAPAALIWCAFVGAAVAALCVYVTGAMGRGGATPLKLALAGVIISAFLASLTAALLMLDQNTLDQARLWSVGSLSGRTLESVHSVAPYGLAGLVATALSGRHIMTLSLGTELAGTVGQNLAVWRLASAMLVVLLAGSAVALAGPVGFVGLVVPHAARLLAGQDYRWIIALSAPMGALLVVIADAGMRQVVGMDMPVGIAMALVGAPVFIVLARRQGWAMR